MNVNKTISIHIICEMELCMYAECLQFSQIIALRAVREKGAWPVRCIPRFAHPILGRICLHTQDLAADNAATFQSHVIFPLILQTANIKVSSILALQYFYIGFLSTL